MKIRTLYSGMLWAWMAAALLAANPCLAGGAQPNDSDSLRGLKSTKAVFDVTTGNPKKLSFYLNLIEQTADSMRSAGVKPDFVVTFRGPATFFVSSDRERIKLEDTPVADKIQGQLDELSHKPNVKLEQCSVAAKALHVDTRTIYPSVKVVGNSWISLIGYQNRGYALVPVR